MRILFVSDRDPIPPSDGVSVPLAGIAEGLARRGHEVCLLEATDGARDRTPPSSDDASTKRTSTPGGWHESWSVPVRRTGRVAKALDVLLRRRPGFAGIERTDHLPDGVTDRTWDVVWTSPRRLLHLVAAERDAGRITAPLFVAGVNDVWTVVRRTRAADSRRSLVERAGLALMGVVGRALELDLLERFEVVHVQSPDEGRWLARTRPALAPRVLAAHNGVPRQLFDIPIERAGRVLVLVGPMDGVYGTQTAQILRRIWPDVRARFPDARCRAYGAGRVPMELGEGVEVMPYEPDIRRIYGEAAVLLAPVFKGYGFINKVAEAMAAGTAVVGDPTAFNAMGVIPEDVAGVATTPREFRARVMEILESPDRGMAMRRRARRWARARLDWDSTVERVEARLDRLTVGR